MVKRFYALTEKQMSKTAGGELVLLLVYAATVLSGLAVGIGIDQAGKK